MENDMIKILSTKGKDEFYICSKYDEQAKLPALLSRNGNLDDANRFIPVWLTIILILVLLVFSALFSGLNLGLMALDRTDLKIISNTGTEKERKYARTIIPVREEGNYLLCSILLGNVLVNATLTILFDTLVSGMFAIALATFFIVILSEITPQAVCSRHGLYFGAKTIYIMRFIMLLTFPLSYPLSRILNFILGKEIGAVYTRERLKELIRINAGLNDLDKMEVRIILGALELDKKTVGEVMTLIDDAFMVSLDAVLDFQTVSEIMKSGYSRVPVYDGDRKNIVTLLYIKDLAFVDTDDNTAVRTLCEFYQYPVHFVAEDYTLDVMFARFKDGSIGHIAFVHRYYSEDNYDIVGLITLEDVIEELIQAEIVDETDVFVDNRQKVRRFRSKKRDISAFAEVFDTQRVRISPQQTLAIYQFLSASVDGFKSAAISENVLRRLLSKDIVYNIKVKDHEKYDPALFIFQQGKPVDYFALILEGHVEVTIGKENLIFESGPFSYFGTQALVSNAAVDTLSTHGSLQSLKIDAKARETFIPDFSVRATTDVVYLAIKRGLYLAAKKSTLLERSSNIDANLSDENYV